MVTIPTKAQWLGLNLVLLFFVGCSSGPEKETKITQNDTTKTSLTKKRKTPSKIFNGNKIPVLCYHAIRNIEKDDSANQKTYSVSPTNFASQIRALATNGYTTITPDQLKAYYSEQNPLPQKPILITFDDGRKEHYSIAAGILDQYHFKGVFFIMTVAMGKPNYMNQFEIKTLSESGHTIGCHTWDHHKVTGYDHEDWQKQLFKPKKKLESITHKPVTSFAYPYGVWNLTSANSVKKQGFTTAFIVYGKADNRLPLFTLQRIIVKNSGTTGDFLKQIEQSSNNN
jgi:peptidoglycan/xylan/chitin deacetylase (PgdA/CDA1 family)